MEDFEPRLTRLANKISRSGAIYLRRFRDHPRIAELMAYIETLDGLLLQSDIEQAARRYFIQHPDKS